MRQRSATNRIIFHHSLSQDVSAATIADWHRKRGMDTIGYHFVIREDGRVENGRDVSMIGAHAKGRNSDSIGVCLTGDFSRHSPDARQVVAAAKLYKEMCGLYGKELEVEYHRNTVNPCPGALLCRDVFTARMHRGR